MSATLLHLAAFLLGAMALRLSHLILRRLHPAAASPHNVHTGALLFALGAASSLAFARNGHPLLPTVLLTLLAGSFCGGILNRKALR